MNLKAKVYELNLPLRVPFVTAKRRIDAAHDILLQLCFGDLFGIGTAPPTLELTGEHPKGIVSFLQHVALPFLGDNKFLLDDFLSAAFQNNQLALFSSLARIMEGLNKRSAHNLAAKSCLEMALLDLAGKQLGLPVGFLIVNALLKSASAVPLPPATAKTPHSFSDVTISLASPWQMSEQLSAEFGFGYRTFKVKLSGNKDDDILRIVSLKNDLERLENENPESYGSHCLLMLDANEGFLPQDFCEFLPKAQNVLGKRLLLVEQPCHRDTSLDHWKRICSLGSDIFFDESIFSVKDLHVLCEAGLGHGCVVKIVKAGGLWNAAQWIKFAIENRKKVLLSCMLESPVSVTAAAQLGQFLLQCQFCRPDQLLFDLDPVHLFSSSTFITPWSASEPARIPNNFSAGLGIGFSNVLEPIFEFLL